MKIVLLGHEDIASKIAFRLISALLPNHDYALFLSGPPGDVDPPAAIAELAAIDRSFCDLLSWNLDGRIEALREPNSDRGLEKLKACDPDLIVSVRYRRILKSAAIRIPRHGVLNLHSGLLPDYKGVMATFWAMLNGEPEIGCTLHRIVDDTVDTGPIIGRSSRPVRTEWSYLANVLELYPDGCRMVADAVKRIAAGAEVATMPQVGAGHYYSLPRQRDLELFEARGLRLADAADLGAFLQRHRSEPA